MAFAKRMYNSRASAYESSWHPSFAQKFTSLANPQPGHHVLDLACGTGLVTFDAARRVASSGSVVGIDVSEGMMQIARQKKQQLGGDAANVELVLHDVRDLDGPSEMRGRLFDGITIASALVLLKEVDAMVVQCVRYLKPGGVITVDVPHPKNLIVSRLLEDVGEQMGVPAPYHRSWVKGPESLRKLLENAGLAVEKEEFVEQAGYHRRYYDVDEADDRFVSQLMTESGRDFRMPTERREKALELFTAEWKKAAQESGNGKVEEIDGVFVAVARKPL